jgi:predicted alpha/beta superfamily hydrolase
MKKLFTLIALTILSNFSYGQDKKDIVIGKRFSIKSEILNSEREISVYLPNSYNQNNYTNYPVLYLLDGRKFFNSFSGVITQLSSDASPQLPEMIVIGITSQDRVRDSSPTNSLIGYTNEEEKGLEVSGGADNFLQFIQKELIPFVEKNYRTNSYRTFVGYSFTGLPVLQALFSIPETFNSYLIIDFSAWWDDEVMKKRLKKFTKEYKGSQRDLFIATVDRVSNKVYPEKYNTGWDFIQELEQNPPANISFDYKKYGYKEENHHSMPLISFIDGMKYIFRGHMINYDEMYTNPKLIKHKLSKLSERLGYNVYLPEGLINFFGYLFLYTRPDIEKAFIYFNYYTQNYPLSSNAWDGLGDAYQFKGDKKKAIVCFNKALKLNPKNIRVKNKLEKLKIK